MTKVIGVRFRPEGKIYFYSTGKLEMKRRDQKIVETARGVEFGIVVMGPKEVKDEEITQPLKTVIRLATEDDRRVEEKNRKKEKEAFQICLEKIHKHGLEMKLIDAEYTFDNNKVLFYFTADGRIDFRELVKDLAAVFRTRIELRQIGVRDETKLRGGIGNCGRELCCHTYLSEFAPVSIKMAKEQNLSLNPTKISGVCGRLLCCLKYEDEAYKEVKKKFPKIGSFIRYEDKQCKVVGLNVISDLVKIDCEGSILFIPLSDIDKKPAPKKERRILEELAPKKEKKHDKSKQKKPRQQHKQKQNNQKPRNIKGNNPKGKKDERRN